ncbi:MAG: hypothetical protein GF388_10000 [Candidatus Aegiribacteria sp.]|nr:hypothetical protein [Candidatus Aegiribacteria sp.]MBD3295365.1 hypothetical protein [Candidatus Fermentibacteria bacterium]
MMERIFLSDVHLYPEPEEHPGRKKFLDFLEHILENKDPGELWILGDLFDFWFEFSSAIPSGYGQCLFALQRLTRAGWKISLLRGNHDFWAGRQLEDMTGLEVHESNTAEIEAGGRKVLLAHGDGMGPGDLGYRILKPIIRSRAARFIYRMLQPDIGSFLARSFSGTSRRILRRDLDRIPNGLTQWVQARLEEGFDIVITGHTHLDKVLKSKKGIHVSLGDWLTRFTYCIIDEEYEDPVLVTHRPGSRGEIMNGRAL